MTGWDRIDLLLAEAVDGGALPGVVAGVTTREGVAYRFARGKGAADQPIAFDSMFWIASMTKAITSVAAMQLVEQGRLALDAPLEELLPRLRDRQILEGFDAGGRPSLRPATVPVTLAHMLSHTSGLAENVWHADIARYVEATGMPTGATGRLAALDLPLLFEPGSAWQYGISHDYVGLAVEAASGQRLDDYFAQNLFAPLGMADTTYAPDQQQKERLVRLHVRAPDGSLVPHDRTLLSEREFFSGGGTMFSKADDYLAFIRMLLNGGEAGGGRVLGEQTVRALAENRTGDLPVSRLDPAIPAMSNAAEFLPGTRKCWGLGTMVNLEDAPSGRRAGSLAWAGLGNTYFWADPEAGIGGVLLTQILPFADAAVLKLFDAFEAEVYRTA